MSEVQGNQGSVNTKDKDDYSHIPPYDRVAAAVSVFIFFVILFVFAVFETYASPPCG